MKSIIKNIAGFICVIIGLNSCENINDVHEEYLKRGEEIYTGVVDSLEAYPGNERIKFTWMINADPRITKTVIYWNDGGRFCCCRSESYSTRCYADGNKFESA